MATDQTKAYFNSQQANYYRLSKEDSFPAPTGQGDTSLILLEPQGSQASG